MSVSGVTTSSIDHSCAPAVHRAHQSVGLPLGDLPPHLAHSDSKLSCCLGSGVELVQLPLKGIPEMLYWVKVGRTGWVRQQIDVVLPQEVLRSTGSVRPCVVLLKQVLWMPLEMRQDVGPQNLVDVMNSSDPVTTSWTHILEDDWPNTAIYADSPRDHDAFTTPWVPFGDVGIREAFPRSSPDPDAAIAWVDAEPAFITEEDSAPVPMAPMHVDLCPLQTVLAMLECQDRSPGWTPALETNCVQSATHGPVADWPAMVADGVPGCVGSGLVRLPSMLTKKMAVLGCCGDPRSAAPRSVISGVSCLKAVQKAIDGGNVDSECDSDLPHWNPGLQLPHCYATILTRKSRHYVGASGRDDLNFLGFGNL